MKLEEGMYVRTKRDGIGKIISLNLGEDDDCCFIELSNRRTGIKEHNILKASYNIIDLIEVGDYVNGCLVEKSKWENQDIKFIQLDTLESWGWGAGTMPEKYIKSIVTKEQFKSMEYEVE